MAKVKASKSAKVALSKSAKGKVVKAAPKTAKSTKIKVKPKMLKAKVQPKPKAKIAKTATKSKPVKRPQKAIHLSEETQSQMATNVTKMVADLFLKQTQEFDKMLSSLKQSMKKLFSNHVSESTSNKSGEKHPKKSSINDEKEVSHNEKSIAPNEQETG